MGAALTRILEYSREKNYVIVNLVGVILGFIVVGVTSNGAISTIKASCKV
jgi:hypothetical protein